MPLKIKFAPARKILDFFLGNRIFISALVRHFMTEIGLVKNLELCDAHLSINKVRFMENRNSL